MPTIEYLRIPAYKESVSRKPLAQRGSRQKNEPKPLHPLLTLQHTTGNPVVGRMIQAKLNIGQPEDKYVLKADRVAKQVMRVTEPETDPVAQGGTQPIKIVCPKKIQTLVVKAIRHAKILAKNAAEILNSLLSLPILTKHFGSLNNIRRSNIKNIYDRIFNNLDRTVFRCSPCEYKWEPTGETSPGVTHDCGRAPCPGLEIILCPKFGKAGCPGGPTILHESAHNAGACDDIQQGSGNYPPGNPGNMWPETY